MKILRRTIAFAPLLAILLALPAFAQISPELLKRAEAGEAEAQFEVGGIYNSGEGAPQDYKKAVEWYTKAANQGFSQAQSDLGIMYVEGRGVAKNADKAFEWFTKAANQGDLFAQANLGIMYYNGIGRPQDIVTGCAWLYVSKDPVGGAACDSKLTPEQKTKVLGMKDEISKKIVPKAAE